MGKCNITILIPGMKETVTIAVDSDIEVSGLQDFAIWLANDTNPELKQQILGSLNDIMLNNINSIAATLGPKKYGISSWNATLKDIAEIHPEVKIPEGIAMNFRLVDSLRSSYNDYNGLIETSDGVSVMTLINDRMHIQQGMDHLRVRKQIENNQEIFDPTSNDYAILEQIYMLKNPSTKKESVSTADIQDMMLHFMEHKYDYINIDVDGKNAIDIMDRMLNIIREQGGNIYYNNAFVGAVNNVIQHSGKGTARIRLDTLFDFMRRYIPDLAVKYNINNENELLDLIKHEGDQRTAFLNDLNNAFAIEPEFWFRFESINTIQDVNYMQLKSHIQSIGERYSDSISMETMKAAKIEEQYKGFNIYKIVDDDGNEHFYALRGYVDFAQKAHRHMTLTDVKADIDRIEKRYSLNTLAFPEIHFRREGQELDSLSVDLKGSLTDGTVIGVLDIAFSPQTRFREGEKEYVDGRMKMADFEKLVKSWKISGNTKDSIIAQLDTAEKVVAFLYLLNQQHGSNRTNMDDAMLDILSKIDEASKRDLRYYYVQSHHKNAISKKMTYNLIPMPKDDVRDRFTATETPVVKLMNAIVDTMNNKLGTSKVDVNLLSTEQITARFGNDIDPSAKAFVKDGQIYVNTTLAKSSDMIHEYIHLILGFMKASSELRPQYELLMNTFASTNYAKDLIDSAHKRYKNLSEMDYIEEAFAEGFGYFINDHIKVNYNNNKLEVDGLFNELTGQLVDVTNTIFDAGYKGEIKNFFQYSINQGFIRFNNDIAKLMNKPGLSFVSTRDARQISDYIRKKIHSGEIIEKC